MGRALSNFRQADLTRAVRGARAAGLEVARIEIDRDGKIVILTPTARTAPSDPYETWKAGENGPR